MRGKTAHPKLTHKTALITPACLRTLRQGPVGPHPQKGNKVSVLHVLILELRGQWALFPD